MENKHVNIITMRISVLLTLMLATLFYLSVNAEKHRQAGSSLILKGQHPVISEIVSAISKDSLAAQMQWMVDMGTRFMYAENRREVASGIASRFRSFGYTDIVLDSFKMQGENIADDSVWQYNVVATSVGASAPGEVYIISAHHDNYRVPDPHMPVPGADDNASGCALVLEIARVLKAKGFQPASTIRFVTYAAEELVGYKGISGSIYFANKMKAENEDLRLDINNDMVAWAKDSTRTIFGSYVRGRISGWAGELMMASAEFYASSLNVVRGEYPTSDATRFSELGFPVTGFQEFNLNPMYHTVNDSLKFCNMDVCLEVSRANCAILLNEQLTPVPQQTDFSSDGAGISISWKPTKNANVRGYRIYRSLFPDSAFSLISLAGPLDSVFRDTTAKAGTLYYYYPSSFDQFGYESFCANIIPASIFLKDRELLIVKDSRGGFANPKDSAVSNFYNWIFRNLNYDYSDASVMDSLDIRTLSRYKKIFWLSNSYASTESSFRNRYEDVTSYLKNGGSLFLAGFQPTYMVAGNKSLDKSFLPADTLCRWYKIKRVMRKPVAQLNGAWPCENEYDSLRIHPGKCYPEPPGHIADLECLYPSADAKVIFRFNSAYDTTSNLGKMKGKPVGIEYTGDDHKVIVLSVPLYYMDSLDAKGLAELVNYKLSSHVGIGDNQHAMNKSLLVNAFPNPVGSMASLRFYLPEKAGVKFSMYDIMGNEIRTIPKRMMEAGYQTIPIDLTGLQAGVYFCRIMAVDQTGYVSLIKH